MNPPHFENAPRSTWTSSGESSIGAWATISGKLRQLPQSYSENGWPSSRKNEASTEPTSRGPQQDRSRPTPSPSRTNLKRRLKDAPSKEGQRASRGDYRLDF